VYVLLSVKQTMYTARCAHKLTGVQCRGRPSLYCQHANIPLPSSQQCSYPCFKETMPNKERQPLCSDDAKGQTSILDLDTLSISSFATFRTPDIIAESQLA
jgi:hypothetical protein